MLRRNKARFAYGLPNRYWIRLGEGELGPASGEVTKSLRDLPKQMDSMLLVKKYANRRLYDTSQSRYVTLDELAERIRGGQQLRVEDAKTGADLTQSVLAQIILESRGAAKLLPSSFLAQLIRMDDADVAFFLGQYLTWALEVYLQAKQTASHLGPFGPLAQAPFQATSAIARLFGGLHPTMPWAAPPVRTPTVAAPEIPPAEVHSLDAHSRPQESDLEALRAEIASLRELVQGSKKK